MEKDTSYELEVINSPKVENDSLASENPEDHGDSDHIKTANKNDQVQGNEDVDNTGVFIFFQ